MRDIGPEDDWEGVGRRLLVDELFESSERVTDSFTQLKRSVRDGEEIDPEDVREARQSLRRANRVLENCVAGLAGLEPWDEPPTAPYPKIRQWAGVTEDDDEQ